MSAYEDAASFLNCWRSVNSRFCEYSISAIIYFDKVVFLDRIVPWVACGGRIGSNARELPALRPRSAAFIALSLVHP